jgi:hypothetical protein
MSASELGGALSTARIKVLAEVRLRAQDGERQVTLVALSARGALVLSVEPVGAPGEVVDLHLPVVGGATVAVAAGIDSVERVAEGTVSKIEFMIVERHVRDALDELLALLLTGDGGGTRRCPRVKYPIPVRYGERGDDRAKLIEISMKGLSMRVAGDLAEGARVRVELPDAIVVTGSVVNRRASPTVPGAVEVGVAFGTLERPVESALRKLLADVVRRAR